MASAVTMTSTLATSIHPIHAGAASESIHASSDFSGLSISTTDEQKPSYILLISNEYFLARILTLFFTIFLFILSLSYTIGQTLSLEFVTPFCEKKTAEEVAKHSIDNGLNGGGSNSDGDGCWSTKIFTKNGNKLWSNDSYIGVPQSIGFKFIAFMLVTLLFICFIILYTIKLIIDIKLYRNKKLGANVNIKSPKSPRRMFSFRTKSRGTSNVQHKHLHDIISKGTKLLEKLYQMYQKVFYTDSGWWIIKKILTEIFEIFIQTSALLYYNGYVLFSSSENRDDVVLSLKHQYILLFTVFLSMNCVFSCIIWLFYAFKPVLCNGLVFEVVLYAVDVVFDVFYTLFPLMVVVQNNSTLITALASLEIDDAIAFWATFIPLIFLCWASFSFSRKSRIAMAAYYASLSSTIQMTTAAVTSPNITVPPPHMANVPSSSAANASASNASASNASSSIAPSLNTISSVPVLYSSTSFIHSTTTKVHNSMYKRVSIIAVALMFGIYGIVLISTVSNHFTTAISHCSSVVHELNQLEFIYDTNRTNTEETWSYSLPSNAQNILNNHNELFFWDGCKFKVYPFGADINGDPRCECRYWKISRWDRMLVWSIDELYDYFGITLIDILESMLRKWNMLEKFSWDETLDVYRTNNKKEPPVFNMSKDMFNARKMRIFSITETPISYIDPAIANWKTLAFLDMGACYVVSLPDSIKHLTSLQYLDIGESTEFDVFPEAICAMKKLKVISMETTSIKYIPHCVAQLPELQSLILHASFLLEGVPLELFAMNNLVEFSGIRSKISLQSLMSYNNISSVSELDDVFVWNPDHNYWFETSDFCEDAKALSTDSNFFQFVNDTKCCEEACKITSAFDAYQCLSPAHADGICDNHCNNARCGWDGGDCSQLCECDVSSFGDGVCDIACNTTNCLYDGYDCIPASFDAIECESSYESHGCSVDWVGDLWCDSLCFESIECGQDDGDCDSCSRKTNCDSVYSLFSFVATVKSNDNFVSIEELEAVWYLQSELNPFGATTWESPADAMNKSDLNNDGLLSMREAIIGLHDIFNITKAKALQVDCSKCFDGYWDA